MINIYTWLQRFTGISPDILKKFVASFLIISIFWIIKLLIVKLVYHYTTNNRYRYNWKKAVNYLTAFVGFIIIGGIWLEGLDSVATFFGLISAGLAIVLKDIIVNIAGWVFIVLKQPFVVGDRIQISNHSGDVIDIRIFQFTILEIGNWVDADQSTGRIIHIPNGEIFSKSLANYDKGFHYIWNEIPVLITFESDWKKARRILENIAQEKTEKLSDKAMQKIHQASQNFFIYYTKLDPRIYLSVRDYGVLLTLRYLCGARSRRDSEENIWETILTEFSKHQNIDFAYPTQRFYNNTMEGKHTLDQTNGPVVEKDVQ